MSSLLRKTQTRGPMQCNLLLAPSSGPHVGDKEPGVQAG